MRSDLPDAVLELAEQQLGVLARHQLLRRSLTRGVVEGAVRRGRLVALERGVYVVPGGASVPAQRAFAAMLRVGAPATITGPAVLAHLRVPGVPVDAPFEVLVPPGRRLTGVDFPWRVDPRQPRAVTRAGEVRLALGRDALVDSVRWRAEIGGDRVLRSAYHDLAWRGHLRRDRFVAALADLAATDADAAVLLDLLGGTTLARCESPPEAVLGDVLLRFDPAPEPQAWATSTRRVDWLLRVLRLAIEYHGRVDHDAEVDRAADAARDAELAAAGIAVLVVRHEDLADVPALLTRLMATMVQRAHELGVPTPTYDPTRTSPLADR